MVVILTLRYPVWIRGFTSVILRVLLGQRINWIICINKNWRLWASENFMRKIKKIISNDFKSCKWKSKGSHLMHPVVQFGVSVMQIMCLFQLELYLLSSTGVRCMSIWFFFSLDRSRFDWRDTPTELVATTSLTFKKKN